jgi:hypothetical protein
MILNTLPKKLIGTLTITSLVIGSYFITSTDVFAQFKDMGSTLKVDGVIGSVDEDSLILQTSGAQPIEVFFNNKTKFSPRRLDPEDLMQGDQVEVQAKVRNGQVLGTKIKLQDEGPGYGTEGDDIFVKRGEVIAKTANTFTIETNATVSTFKVKHWTRFSRVGFNGLEVGDKVEVRGVDTGSEFIARKVVIKKHSW